MTVEYTIPVGEGLKTADLRVKYLEAFGVETRSSNKQFLFRRIAWRLQGGSRTPHRGRPKP